MLVHAHAKCTFIVCIFLVSDGRSSKGAGGFGGFGMGFGSGFSSSSLFDSPYV